LYVTETFQNGELKGISLVCYPGQISQKCEYWNWTRKNIRNIYLNCAPALQPLSDSAIYNWWY